MLKNKYGEFVLFFVHGLTAETITSQHPLWAKFRVNEHFDFNGEDAVIFEYVEDAFMELEVRNARARAKESK